MKQEEKTIYDFKKGDVITRVKPLIGDSGPLGDKDYSLVGKKVTFLGIANASVYLSKPGDFLTSLLLGKETITIQLPLELAENGWADYIEPDFIDSDAPILEDEESIKKEIGKAVKEDDYERANALKKKLEEIKNSRNPREVKDE
jgi:hypothetical protein